MLFIVVARKIHGGELVERDNVVKEYDVKGATFRHFACEHVFFGPQTLFRMSGETFVTFDDAPLETPTANQKHHPPQFKIG